MKKFYTLLTTMTLICACGLLDPIGGDGTTPDDQSNQGRIYLSFCDDDRFSTKAGAVLDTNSFLITITNPAGTIIYDGPYSSSPQSFLASSGTYYIKVVSQPFTKPAWETVQWGDEQYVKLENGKSVKVKLLCRQLNSGVRLNISPNFTTVYPDAALLLKSASGSLPYSVREKRTAFFLPESMQLVMSRGAKDETLLTRILGAGEILTLNINTPSQEPAQSSISISVDTSRVYVSGNVNLGGGSGGDNGGGSGKGDEPGNALTVAQAMSSVGMEDVWVGGYIVGGDLSSKGMSTDPPYSAASNLALGPRSNTTDRGSCIAVQLPTGAIRDALNLVDNEEVQGRYVYLHGDIVEPYFGMVGLKNVDDYQFK